MIIDSSAILAVIGKEPGYERIKRDEFFGPHGITARTFRDPNGSSWVGLIVEIPDFAAFEQLMQTEEAAAAMKHDGVRPETLLILSEH